ncbi:MAG: EAL domain-containing protein [Firmicutes bacterium]|nr:EAL domain-containing protein [Bacillota bacterium]
MKNKAKEFDVILTCNLTRNTYEIKGGYDLFLTDGQMKGVYDELIANIASLAPGKYSEMLLSCFTTGALLSAYNADNTHVFCNAFFKYAVISKAHSPENVTATKWAAVVVHILPSDSEDILANVVIRTIGEMYNDCEIQFITDEPAHAKAKLMFDYDACRMAIVYDSAAMTFEMIGGTLFFDDIIPLSNNGDIHDLIAFFSPFLDTNSNASFMSEDEFINITTTSADTYGGYYFKRLLFSFSENRRWYELAVLALDDDCQKYLVTLKDIHDLLSEKTYVGFINSEGSFDYEKTRSVLLQSSRLIMNRIKQPYCSFAIEAGFPVRAANDLFYRAIGYTPEAFEYAQSNNLISLVHPADIPYMRHMTRDVVANGKDSQTFEIRIIRNDGNIRWVRLEVSYVIAPDEILGFLAGEDITDKKLSEQSKLSDRQNFNLTYAKNTNILFDYDCRTHVLKDRGGLAEKLGFPPEVPAFDAFINSGELTSEDDEAELKRIIANIRSGAESISGSLRIKVPKYNDRFARIGFTLSAIFDYKGQPKQLIGVIDKISLQQDSQSQDTGEARPAAEAPEELHAAHESESVPDLFKVDLNAVGMQNVLGNFVVNLTTDTVESHGGFLASSSQGLERLDGITLNELIQEVAAQVVSADSRQLLFETVNTAHLLEEFENGNTDIAFVLLLSSPAISNKWAKVFIHTARDESGDVRALIYGIDVSEEYRKINALEKVSTKDPLTGLMNRAGASESISAYLNTISDNEICAFMIMDLDNFKEINDIYGHQTGDDYLKSLAEALTDFLPEAIVARLGGDEFVVFLKNCDNTSQVSNTALSILKIIRDVNHSRITAFNTTGSIGIALVPSYGKDFDTLYHNADVALYEVKNNNKDGFMFCDDRNPTVQHTKDAGKRARSSLREFFSHFSLAMYGLLITALLLAGLITFGIFRSAASEVYDQANSHLAAHSEVSGKYMSLYLSNLQDDASWITQIATNHQDALLNLRAGISEELDSRIDDMVVRTSFDNVMVVTENGKLVYSFAEPAKPGITTVAEGLQNRGTKLPDAVGRIAVNDGSLVFASNIYSDEGKRRAILLCTVNGSTISDVLQKLSVYTSEEVFLADAKGVVIGTCGSDYSTLFKYYSDEYLEKRGFVRRALIPHIIVGTDDVRHPSLRNHQDSEILIGSRAEVKLAQLYTKYYVFSTIPQSSILSEASISLKIIITLILCLFGAIALATTLIVRTNKRSSKYVDNLAYKDSLTILNNMNYLVDNSKAILKKCGEPCGIVSLNIDNFRIIRDAYGPSKSNKLISCIGTAISDFIGNDEAAGRVSDASFCLVLSYVGENAFNSKLKNLRSYIFSSCSTYMATPVNFNISIGVYISESMGESIKQSYDFADLARSYMKETTGDGIYYYNTRLQQSIQKQKLIEDSLDAALENGEFIPYYQPIVNIFSHQVVACEALARWIKPDGTIVPPSDFIQPLDKRGSIISLDYYMLEKVCAQMQIWKDTPLDGIAISINMSRQHFYQPDFIERLMRTTAKYGIPNSRIHIEITENIYIGDTDLINKTLTELRDNGFLVSMDDFGTGYSSMSMLQTMPVDILKIDKNFLDSSLSKDNGIIVLDGIVNIAKQLGLKTICEGVETSTQLNWLKTVGCDMVQGFYYSKPIPSGEFERFVIDNLYN